MPVVLSLVTRDAAQEIFENADIDSYDVSPELADDQLTPVAERISVSVSATISKASWAALEAVLRRFGNRMSAVSVYDPAAPAFPMVYLTSTECSDGGPFVKTTATEIVGTTLMMIRADITAHRPFCQTRPILAHTWKQSMAVDEAGRLTRTLEGNIRAFGNAPGQTITPAPKPLTFAALPSYSGIADLFRNALMPDVPGPGWRRTSQSFAYDPANLALQYVVTDKQFMHDLPNFVRVGDMDFTYERTAEQAGIANLSFSCELETDNNAFLQATGGWGTGNRQLVQAAVKLSKARINAAYANTIITRMRVTERGLLSGQSIRFELDAQVFPSLNSTSGIATIAPLAYMIGQKFTVARTQPTTVSAFGQPTKTVVNQNDVFNWHIMQPLWTQQMINGMESCGSQPAGNVPVAAFIQYPTDINNSGDITVTVADVVLDTAALNSEFQGKFSSDQYQPPQGDNYITVVSHNVAHTKAGYSSGLVRLSTMYTTGADLVFQTQKPQAIVRERVEVARANVAPAKVFRPLPTGAYVMDEDWNVSFGKFDAQGQRMFIGTYERTYCMIDNGDNGRGFATQVNATFGNIRAWGAPNQTLLPTVASIATTASQETNASVFAGSISADQKYNTGAAQTFIT